jgi:hypothetical protein
MLACECAWASAAESGRAQTGQIYERCSLQPSSQDSQALRESRSAYFVSARDLQAITIAKEKSLSYLYDKALSG